MTIAVGFFDGVHLGHRAILEGADAALTFATHPLALLAPERAPKLLMTLEERLAAIRAVGVKQVEVLDFTPDLASKSPAAFASAYFTPSQTTHSSSLLVRCGANWHFGKGGEGDVDWLRRHGYAVEAVPLAEWRGGRISSSRIRAALAAGGLAEAAAMLGRAVAVRGRPFAGKGAGRSLGFPTVNLSLGTPLAELLPHGAYAVEVAGGVRGIANFGVAPTFGEGAWPTPVLEVHFPGRAAPPAEWAGDEVTLVRFLRPERAFESVDDLRRQIAADCTKILI